MTSISRFVSKYTPSSTSSLSSSLSSSSSTRLPLPFPLLGQSTTFLINSFSFSPNIGENQCRCNQFNQYIQYNNNSDTEESQGNYDKQFQYYYQKQQYQQQYQYQQRRAYTTVNTSKWWAPDLNLFKKESHLYGDGAFATRKRLQKGTVFPTALNDKTLIPSHIMRPSYAMRSDGRPPPTLNEIQLIKDKEDVQHLRNAGKLARKMLDLACSLAENNVGITPHQIDTIVHRQIIQEGAYPSPLNYAGFPKSICSSINDVVLHGIPDDRPLEKGDIIKFDVSLYLKGFHGDNCGLVYLSPESFDLEEKSTTHNAALSKNQQSTITNNDKEEDLDSAATKRKRHLDNLRLIEATQKSLNHAIEVCKPGNCLSDIGEVVESIATDEYGYGIVQEYMGHGIGTNLHMFPFVSHVRNKLRIKLVPGMCFTIEPAIVEGSARTKTWSDGWTVSTRDGGYAAQLEHQIYITETGCEILTLPE